MKNKLRRHLCDDDKYSMSGRTTGRIYFLIGKAMMNPGDEIEIVDHYDTHESNKFLYNAIKGKILVDKLKFLDVYRANNKYYIQYNVFTDSPKQVINCGCGCSFIIDISNMEPGQCIRVKTI